MSLQKTGVILTAENESGFLRAMNNSKGAVNGFEGAIAGVKAPMQGVSLMGLTLANVIGGVLVNAIGAGVSGFLNLAKSAVGVVAANERLIATFESMVAKELRAADATLDMGQALDMASPRARELLKWIEELVIKSPFEREGIVAALQTAVAYGFVTQGAKDLADAQAKGIVTAQRLAEGMVNWAAATGKTSFEVQRATLALGQMAAKGKVTGEELRQLREAGVDVQSALAKMGATIDDVSAGTVDANTFIKTLVETMENDFGAAAERQAGTITGLLSSISDLSQTYLREFFGPINEATGKVGGILGAVQPLLQKFVDTLTNPRVVKAVQTLGLLLGDTLSSGLTKAGGLAGQFATQFAGPIIETANKAFNWGANIAMQLANGLIEGAASAIIGAINFISGMLANWFAPGSPPKVAPDLPIWGASAMVEWLKGFSQADFGTLKGLQSPIQGALQALVGAGKLKSDKANKIYQDLTAQIAKTLAEGGDPEKLFKKIKKATGEFGGELAELARRQFAVATATQAVTQAEKDLEAARKAEFAAGEQISKLSQEYNDMLRGGASQEQLDAKLAEINAQETALEVAKDQGEAAEDAYVAARDNLAVLQEQLKLQQDLVATLIDLAKASNAAGAGGAGGGGGPLEPPAPPEIDTGGVEGAFRDALERIKDMIRDKLKDAFQPLLDAFTKAIAGILEAWNRLMGLFQSSGLADTLARIWDNMIALTRIFIDILYEFISTGLITMAKIWNKHKEQIGRIWEKFWNLIASIAGGVLGLIVQNIDQRLQEARDFFESHRQQISDIIQKLWDNIERIVDFALSNILDFVEDRIDSLQKLWDKYGKNSLKAIDKTWDKIAEIFWFTLGEILDLVEFSLTRIEEFWEKHGEAIQIITTFFMTNAGRIIDGVLGLISLFITTFLTGIAALWALHGESIKRIIQGAFTFIKTTIESVLTIIGGLMEIFAGLITGDFERIKEGVSLLWQGLWDFVMGYLTAALTFVGSLLTIAMDTLKVLILGAVQFVIEKWTQLWTFIQEKIEAGRAFIDSKITLIKNKLSATWDTIQAKAKEIWTNIQTDLEEKIIAIKDKISETLDNIKNKAEEVWGAIKDDTENRYTAIKDFLFAKWDEIKSNIEEKITAIRDFLFTKWDEISGKISEVWETIRGKIVEKVGAVDDKIRSAFEALVLWWYQLWDTVVLRLSLAWDAMLTKATLKIQEIYDRVTEKIEGIIEWIASKVDQFKTAGSNIMQGLIDGLVEKAGEVKAIILEAVQAAIEAAKQALGISSPSKVFMEIAQNTVGGFTKGVEKEENKPVQAIGSMAQGITNTMQALISPPMVSQLATSNTYNNTVNANFNNTVNNGMDLAALDDHILAVVTQAMDR